MLRPMRAKGDGMAEALPGVGRIVAVASGKGGVGKTTVAVNLALALARRGARVGVFDADLYGPNVPLLLGVAGIPPEHAGALLMPLGRRDPKPYIPPLERYGLRVMSLGLLLADTEAVMATGAGLLARQTLRDVLWGELDYLLLDMPPGTGEPQQTLVRTTRVDGAVLVTTPQDLAMLDVGRSMQLFAREGVPVLGLVENMSGLTCPHCGEPIDIFGKSDRSWPMEEDGVEVLGRLPLNQSLGQAVNEEHPLLRPGDLSGAAAVFAGVAQQVSNRLSGTEGSE
jgi:ATP-binding protein involved in chromosome partitioning